MAKTPRRLVSSEPALAGVRAGQHKTLGVERDAGAGQPIGVRLGADEEEQVADRPPHLCRRPRLTPAHRLEHAVAALEAADLAPAVSTSTLGSPSMRSTR